jgi:hypothetical protein
MNINAHIFFGLILGGASLAAVACGGDDGGTTSTSTSTATSTSTSTSTATGGGAGGAGGGGMLTKCEQACTDLYKCGLEKNGAAQLCPGFKGGAEEASFVNGSMNNGCADTCEDNMALAALVDPKNCQGTIGTLKGLNAQFKNVCENGLMAGGAGGGGAGGGGAGGNGGNSSGM